MNTLWELRSTGMAARFSFAVRCDWELSCGYLSSIWMTMYKELFVHRISMRFHLGGVRIVKFKCLPELTDLFSYFGVCAVWCHLIYSGVDF